MVSFPVMAVGFRMLLDMIPIPVNVPPVGVPERVMLAAFEQVESGKPVKVTAGWGLMRTVTAWVSVHPLAERMKE